MIHFDYNVSDLRPDDRTLLAAKAAVLKEYPALRIRITGHCDERGSDQYNIGLGMRRAAAARDFLAVAGVDPARIDVSSLGRERPLDLTHDEAAWARNRRDEFEIVAGGQTLGTPR